MTPTPKNRAIRFFDSQFQRQVTAGEYVLNPFEIAVLPFLFGDVLDLGCGLGNLAIAAAQQGCRVTAIDASVMAIEDLVRRAAELALPLEARTADLSVVAIESTYDCAVAIGLLMFFAQEVARQLLARIKEITRPCGIAAVNVLIEGTTYLDMFEPGQYYLFAERELPEFFGGWTTEYLKIQSFPAPNNSVKRFCTLVARRPAM